MSMFRAWVSSISSELHLSSAYSQFPCEERQLSDDRRRENSSANRVEVLTTRVPRSTPLNGQASWRTASSALSASPPIQRIRLAPCWTTKPGERLPPVMLSMHCHI